MRNELARMGLDPMPIGLDLEPSNPRFKNLSVVRD
jgi:hypothetical protein